MNLITMRTSALSVAAFVALAQAAAYSKVRADFYRQEGDCSDENRGMITSLFESGNATVASDSAYYAIATTQYDAGCTVDFDVDFSRIKYTNQASNGNAKMRNMVAALSEDKVDPKDLHVVTWRQDEVGPAHPIARRQGGVVEKVCQSVFWKDEGVIAIKNIKVTGC